MRTTDAPTRINTVAVTSVGIKLATEKDIILSVTAALISKTKENTVVHAKSAPQMAWPEHITDTARKLIEEIEEQLILLHFEEEPNATKRNDNNRLPPSIVTKLDDSFTTYRLYLNLL
jgi:hypothetical protein